jgi:H+/Cl- antiporter ClcA
MKTAVYIYLAVGCGMLGVVFTYVMLLVCLYFRIDILRNLWLITIPIIFAVALNIFLIEVLSRRKKR